MKSPLQSVKTAIHELYTLSAVVGITYKSDTCPLTVVNTKIPQTHHWNLFPVDWGTLSCRVSMLCPSAHMSKKTTSAFTCKSGTKS